MLDLTWRFPSERSSSPVHKGRYLIRGSGVYKRTRQCRVPTLRVFCEARGYCPPFLKIRWKYLPLKTHPRPPLPCNGERVQTAHQGSDSPYSIIWRGDGETSFLRGEDCTALNSQAKVHNTLWNDTGRDDVTRGLDGIASNVVQPLHGFPPKNNISLYLLIIY